MSTAAPATFNIEQLISCITVVLLDTISSLQDSKEGVVSVSGIYALCNKVHDILGNAMS